MKRSQLRNALFILIAGLMVMSCAIQRSPITGNKRAYGYTWEEEVQLGQKADKQIQQQYGMYQDEELQQYIEDIGQQVLSKSHMRREDTQQKYKETEFHFRVLNSEVPNAFALPGGYVYVTRGLLAHLENEAQLAVVLGHEIGHVAARHSSQRAFEQQVGQIALIGGAVAGQEILGVPGGDILNLGSQAAQLLFLSYSREDERESDQLGVEYAAMEHYEAAEGAGFFSALKRISQQSGQSIPDWASTHPDPSERENTIPELARQWAEKGYEQNIVDTEEFMRSIDGLVFGKNPREGFARDGTFYHPELEFRFQYPDGWQVINQPTVVGVVSDEQDAVIAMEIDSEADSPQASVRSFLSQEGITVQGQQEQTINGLNAYRATATATGQNNTEYRFYIAALAYGGNIYRFTSYTTAQKYAGYESRFVNSINSFQALTDQNILNMQPARLQAFRTDRSAAFSSFVPQDLPMDLTAEDVAIANQVQLNETIEAGTWIKIPR
ncbi:M48 family metalloprotease [Fodinibius sediminis]|uniref:Zn-dependent protease n=1 Tax=Fodinibius sediminis TaxID=1214077 RepID=A0A521EMY7_9BACT|nr:M48 family metalloprotease [Fodinibius sediminis]SMO85293.1 Putative Zn-dependent protease [Fodinibius sediminis]